MAESEHKRVTLIIVTPYKNFFEEKVDFSSNSITIW